MQKSKLNKMESYSNRPPLLKQTNSPPTPVADLSEYTPTDQPDTTSIFTPNKNSNNPPTPTKDLSDIVSPPPIPNAEHNEFKSSVNHQSVEVGVGVTSPRKVVSELPRSKQNYSKWYLLIAGILLGVIINLFSLIAMFLVKAQTRLYFIVGCVVGALVQGAIGLSTYHQIVLQ